MTRGHLMTFGVNLKKKMRFFMGVLERKEREKEQRRNDIIDAAEKVFFSKGFDNASMNDVANEAEYSKGTLYLYFKSKNELCLAILLRSLKLIKKLFLKLSSSPETGLSKLNQVAEFFLKFTQEHPQYYQVLLTFHNHNIECENNNDIYNSCLAKNAEINSLIMQIIISGQNDGSISLTVDAEKLALAIWGRLTGFLPGSILTENKTNKQAEVEPAVVLRYIFELIQNAIKAE